MSRFECPKYLEEMLKEFAKYANEGAIGLAVIWERANDDPIELAKLNVAEAFCNECEAMLSEIKGQIAERKADYQEEPSE